MRITVDHSSKFIGYFDNVIAAAKAYDKATMKHHGEFAALNFKKQSPLH